MTVSEKQKKALVNLLSVNKLGKEICDELNYRYKTMPVKERLQHRLIKMEDEVVLKYAKPIPPSEYPDSISKREPDKTQTIHWQEAI